MFSGTFGQPRTGRSRPCGNLGVGWPLVTPRLAGPPLPALTPACPIHWDWSLSLSLPLPLDKQGPVTQGPHCCVFLLVCGSFAGPVFSQRSGDWTSSPEAKGRVPGSLAGPEQLCSALHRAEVPCPAQSASSRQPRGRLSLTWRPWAREPPEGQQFLSLPPGSTHTDRPLNCRASLPAPHRDGSACLLAGLTWEALTQGID